jgi:hypothetical protein
MLSRLARRVEEHADDTAKACRPCKGQHAFAVGTAAMPALRGIRESMAPTTPE